MNNRYLQDRAMRRDSRRGGRRDRMDGRNPYGSRGGYVVSGRGRRDRAADYDYDMARGGRGRDRDMARGHDGHYPRVMEYEMYGMGGMRPIINDFAQGDYARGNGGRRDYGYDYGMDYGYDMARSRDYGMDYGYDYGMDYASEDMEKEWKEDLKKWSEELKRYDRFKIPKEQVINQAKQMGLKFDKYEEEDFYATYLMKISDDEDNLISNPQMAIIMAKNFLEDKDSKLKGAEKLCAYYYEIIKGEE